MLMQKLEKAEGRVIALERQVCIIAIAKGSKEFLIHCSILPKFFYINNLQNFTNSLEMAF